MPIGEHKLTVYNSTNLDNNLISDLLASKSEKDILKPSLQTNTTIDTETWLLLP
jgi:hypothetical protein